MRLTQLLFLALFSAPTFAFSQAGTTATLILFVGLGGFTLANSLMQLSFFLSGLYKNERFAQNHAALALIPCAIMLAISLYDFSSFSAFMMNLGGIFIAFALALLPVQLSSLAKELPLPRLILVSITALLFLALGFFLAPLALFAVILGSVGYRLSTGLQQYVNLLVALVGAGTLVYWGWQLLQSSGL